MKNGWVKIPEALLLNADITDAECRVYGVIRSFANRKDGTSCFPSTATISENVGCSESKVKRCRKSLKAKGCLNWTKGSKGRSNRYQFPLERGSPINLPNANSDTSMGSPVASYPDVSTETQNPVAGLRLRHGNDICSVKENGDIHIQISHSGEWVNYGGGEDHLFSFGTLTGKAAKTAATLRWSKTPTPKDFNAQGYEP